MNPTPSERNEQPLTDTRFRASVRGWINQAHQHRAQTLLDMRDERMTPTLQRDKDIILIPRDWWEEEVELLEPVDLGWWYTVNNFETVKFHSCKVCEEWRGGDLDEETKTTLSKECKGCAEIFQEPTKTGGKRIAGKGKQPTTKRIQTQVGQQRELRPRSHRVRYNFSDEEEELRDTEDEIQGYLCVSADPRWSGSAEGGENFILTAEELRLSLQEQCKEEDQTVWLTTAQAGFPTTVTEGELDNILDRQLGRPTVRCLHPATSDYI